MKKIPFYKMSGSGNDFVVIDNRRGVFPANVAAWAEKLCHRQEGIGADGLLLLQKSKKADFQMVYYNADGSRANMCGNGARCMAWFAEHVGAAKAPFQFVTDAGLVGAEVCESRVRVQLSEPHDYHPNFAVRALGETYHVFSINTGVPHAVILVRHVEDVDVTNVGRALRYHKAFGPKGTNVNFVQRVNSKFLKVRTYERGVEGETLACGTGIAASAIVMGLRGLIQTPVKCQVRAGDVLEVHFLARAYDAKQPASEVTLEGPVRVTFKGEVIVR